MDYDRCVTCHRIIGVGGFKCDECRKHQLEKEKRALRLIEIEERADAISKEYGHPDWTTCPACGGDDSLYALTVTRQDIGKTGQFPNECVILGEYLHEAEQVFRIECECGWFIGTEDEPQDVVPKGVTFEAMMMREHVKYMMQKET